VRLLQCDPQAQWTDSRNALNWLSAGWLAQPCGHVTTAFFMGIRCKIHKLRPRSTRWCVGGDTLLAPYSCMEITLLFVTEQFWLVVSESPALGNSGGGGCLRGARNLCI
jgi:hypothetical protein